MTVHGIIYGAITHIGGTAQAIEWFCPQSLSLILKIARNDEIHRITVLFFTNEDHNGRAW